MSYQSMTTHNRQKIIELPAFCHTWISGSQQNTNATATSYGNDHLQAWIIASGISAYVQLSRRSNKPLLLSLTDLAGLMGDFAPQANLVTFARPVRRTSIELCFHN
jgi:hypothetical protein